MPGTGAAASYGDLLVTSLVVLGAVCVAAFVLVRVAGRLLAAGRVRGAHLLDVIARVPLEPRRSLYVVEVAGKTLLVGTSEMGLSVLSELDAAEVRARAAARPSFGELVRGAWARRRGLGGDGADAGGADGGHGARGGGGAMTAAGAHTAGDGENRAGTGAISDAARGGVDARAAGDAGAGGRAAGDAGAGGRASGAAPAGVGRSGGDAGAEDRVTRSRGGGRSEAGRGDGDARSDDRATRGRGRGDAGPDDGAP